MNNLYDVIVIGGGPAGLTAALYLARAKYRVLVLEKEQIGGQIGITHEVVNYPGVERISGHALTHTMQRQAETFGAEFVIAEALSYDLYGDIKTVKTNLGEYRCLGLLIAAGAHPRRIGFVGEERYKGRGVAYCATCDGEFFENKEIFVVGGGYAAAEESVFLTKYAKHVTILVRKNDFSCAASVADKAKNHKKITVLYNTVLEEAAGEQGLTYIRYRNTDTGEITEHRRSETFGIFVFAGYEPATESLKGLIELDPSGYIITKNGQKTTVEGVYAAGDICIKPLRQVVTATADGALAAAELEKYVAQMQQKTGLMSRIPPAAAYAVKNPSHTAADKMDSGIFDEEMSRELDAVFSKMEAPLILKLSLDNTPVSAELERFVLGLAEFTEKLSVIRNEQDTPASELPCVKVCRADAQGSAFFFHGVPTGHEFTSFVLGLYNLSGPGQQLDDTLKHRIASIKEQIQLKILVTLSCTLCPDLVVSALRIAAQNVNVDVHVYDIHHFDGLRKKYNVMSVPCLVVNEKDVYFGKKNIQQILDLIT